MAHARHSSAQTAEAVRRAIQTSQASIRRLVLCSDREARSARSYIASTFSSGVFGLDMMVNCTGHTRLFLPKDANAFAHLAANILDRVPWGRVLMMSIRRGIPACRQNLLLSPPAPSPGVGLNRI